MRIVYITAQTPYGRGEQFILPEIIEIKNKGHELIVIPVRPEREIASGKEPEEVANYTIPIPLVDIRTLLKSMFIFIKHPLKVIKVIFKIVMCSGSPKKIIKNLIVLPKGLVIGQVLKGKRIDHIHAHWASTSSTLAYIISELTGIPWSFTAHRWDITENNMLKEKARSAKFIRVISKNGYKEMLLYIGEEYKDKCYVMHVGIKVNSNFERINIKKENSSFIIATPANLIKVKGHIYLIHAIKKLIDEGNDIYCYFFGKGPLECELKQLVKQFNLEDKIIFKGQIAHDQLLNLYEIGEVNCVVLPSIVTDDGEKEGIPVALMEAMAYKIPVISTNTGGIPELLGDGAGIIVEQKNSDELAEAIRSLILNEDLRKDLGEKGYKKVNNEFNLSRIVDELLLLMKK